MRPTAGMRQPHASGPARVRAQSSRTQIVEVRKAGKDAEFILSVFSAKVARTYEWINHVLTWGLDMVWRRKAVRLAGPAIQGALLIDICTGTGETAAVLKRRSPPESTVIGVDMSLPMLIRAEAHSRASVLLFTACRADSLSLRENSADLITISFAARNLNITEAHLLQTFREIYRVLKPGGCLCNLETSQPASPLIRRLFHGYVRTMVIPLGGLFSGSRKAYAYLAQTIPRFYSPETLCRILREAGFTAISYRKLFMGVAAIHIAHKTPGTPEYIS